MRAKGVPSQILQKRKLAIAGVKTLWGRGIRILAISKYAKVMILIFDTLSQVCLISRQLFYAISS